MKINTKTSALCLAAVLLWATLPSLSYPGNYKVVVKSNIAGGQAGRYASPAGLGLPGFYSWMHQSDFAASLGLTSLQKAKLTFDAARYFKRMQGSFLVEWDREKNALKLTDTVTFFKGKTDDSQETADGSRLSYHINIPDAEQVVAANQEEADLLLTLARRIESAETEPSDIKRTLDAFFGGSIEARAEPVILGDFGDIKKEILRLVKGGLPSGYLPAIRQAAKDLARSNGDKPFVTTQELIPGLVNILPDSYRSLEEPAPYLKRAVTLSQKDLDLKDLNSGWRTEPATLRPADKALRLRAEVEQLLREGNFDDATTWMSDLKAAAGDRRLRKTLRQLDSHLIRTAIRHYEENLEEARDAAPWWNRTKRQRYSIESAKIRLKEWEEIYRVANPIGYPGLDGLPPDHDY